MLLIGLSYVSGCEPAETLGMTMRNKYLRRARVLERDFAVVLRCFAHGLPDRSQDVRGQQEHHSSASWVAAAAGGAGSGATLRMGICVWRGGGG